MVSIAIAEKAEIAIPKIISLDEWANNSIKLGGIEWGNGNLIEKTGMTFPKLPRTRK